MISNILIAAQFFFRFPENESADREALDNRVYQLCGLLFLPNKFALEHRELYIALVDLDKKGIVFFGLVLRL